MHVLGNTGQEARDTGLEARNICVLLDSGKEEIGGPREDLRTAGILSPSAHSWPGPHLRAAR